MASEGEGLQEVTQETEEGCDSVDSGNTQIEEPDNSGSENESSLQWRLDIQQEIEKSTKVLPVLRIVSHRLNEIWAEYNENRDALITNIKKLICTSLYGAIENAIRIKPPDKKKQKSRRNRNSRKKYAYAHCQQLFHECPKKLADIVVNNDRACQATTTSDRSEETV